MIEIRTQDNIIYTTAEEQLSDEDYQILLPLLSEKVEKYGKIRWFFEMKDFKGWSPAALWKDLKFDFSHNESLEKVAMVGAKNWEKELTQLMKPLSKGQVKFFNPAEQQEAEDWIRN